MTGNLRSTSALALLRDNAPFRALWLSRSVSFIGGSLEMIALLHFMAGEASSGVAVALLPLVGDSAPTRLSPFFSALSDRLDRKRLMIASELTQGAVITVIALIDIRHRPCLCRAAHNLRRNLPASFPQLCDYPCLNRSPGKRQCCIEIWHTRLRSHWAIAWGGNPAVRWRVRDAPGRRSDFPDLGTSAAVASGALGTAGG